MRAESSQSRSAKWRGGSSPSFSLTSYLSAPDFGDSITEQRLPSYLRCCKANAESWHEFPMPILAWTRDTVDSRLAWSQRFWRSPVLGLAICAHLRSWSVTPRLGLVQISCGL